MRFCHLHTDRSPHAADVERTVEVAPAGEHPAKFFPEEDKMMARFPKRTILDLEGHVRGLTIACESGVAWITQLRDPRDYLLRAGGNFTAYREGQIVVQVLQDAQLEFRLRDRSLCELRFSPASDRYRCAIRPISTWKLCFPVLRRRCGSSICATSPYLR